jgi:L-alanine-DL-glutamate epimerase-like enolase superfamily enzyme
MARRNTQAHADLAADYTSPIAVGENLFSLVDGRNLLRHAGLRTDRDWLQFDPSPCYGPTEFIAMLQMSRDFGWSPRRHGPHGGQQLGGTETYPLVFQPFGGFGDQVAVVDGQVAPPEIPGVGVESKAELYNTVLKPLLAG